MGLGGLGGLGSLGSLGFWFGAVDFEGLRLWSRGFWGFRLLGLWVLRVDRVLELWVLGFGIVGF